MARRGNAASFDIDDLDEKIIAALRDNGRIATRDLARVVGVKEATVRAHLRRLEDNNVVRVVAMRDLTALGYDCLSAVGVQVRGRPAADVAADLAKIEQVITAAVSIGTHDLEIQVVAHDLRELDELLTGVVAKVDGVDQLFPSVALKVMKYVSEWAPF
ncbi:AsnC family transcriptional regulator [Sphingomonas sp. DBB INV C78]|uniref:Lrp/AsnC family transcriptional regulator n=1 Tax=Sphingomonas sp. DBB INV C78 TaxID=3349434 RepID=UPI0036D22CA6